MESTVVTRGPQPAHPIQGVMRRLIHASIVFWLLPATLTMAQSFGTVRGVVRDSSGAVLPGATVAVTSTSTQQRFEAVTNESGSYTVTFLPPGDYNLEVALAGFGPFTRENIRVNIAATVVIDASLRIGAVAETVTVSGGAPQLQLSTSSLGSTVEGKMLTGMPLSSRNFTQVLSLSPGVNSDVADAGAFGRNSVNISSNGARPWDNGVVMNGLAADNPMSQGFDDTNDKTGIPVPAPDAIEEFKVQAGLSDAEFGKQGGAVVNIVTKSGGAEFHGTAYGFFRDDALNANDFFRNRSGAPKPILNQKQYGASVGGPLIPRRSFFFVSYQGTRQENGVSSSSARSTFLPLLGDRSREALGALYGGQSGVFGGVSVAPDGSNIHPVALNILNAKLSDGQYVIPDPQIIVSSRTGFSALSDPARFRENQIVTNLDHNLSSKQRVTGKVFYASFPSTLPFSLSSNVFGFGETDEHSNLNVALSHTYVLNATTVNELRVGFNRSDMNQVPNEPITAADIGMRPAVAEKPGMPRISVSGLFDIGPNTNNDQRVLIQTWEIANTLSKSLGAHQVRIGGSISPTRVTRHEVFVKRGSLTFLSFPDLLLGMSGSQNGTPYSNVSSSFAGNGREVNHPSFDNFALFIQDDFRVNDRLSVNLGLRYQFNGHQYDADGTEANFDKRLIDPDGPPPGGSLLGYTLPSNVPSTVPIPPGVKKLDHKYLADSQFWKGFSPRLGVIWKPLSGRENVVLRGGYGVFFSAVAGTVAEQTFVIQPFYRTIFGGGAAFPDATLQDPFNLPQLSEFPFWTPYEIGSGVAAYPYDPAIEVPRTQQYTVNMQAEWKQMLFQVGYVGSRTTNLIGFLRVNQALPATPENPVHGETTTTLGNILRRVPILGFPANGYFELSSSHDGIPFRGHYNSMQFSVNKRYGSGIAFSGAYTWSRSIDDIGASSGGRNQPLGSVIGDFHDPREGVSDYDRTHRFVASYLWELPMIDSAGGAVAALVNGWSVSGVTTVQSGRPFSITDSRGGTVFGSNSYGQFAAGKNASDGQLNGDTRDRLNRYFDTSIFVAPPRVGDGTGFGNAGRNIFRGPGQVNFDMALVKLFSMPRGRQLEFRTEAFNIFNTPQFANPGSNAAVPSTFGVISQTVVAPRIFQLALKYRF
jgi:hypothetical protein